MKKYISLLFAASLALVACQKEQIVDDARVAEEKSGRLYTYEFVADTAATKMNINSYGGSVNSAPIWESGDAVTMFKTSDGSNLGSATVDESEVGKNKVHFTFSTTAEPGTVVRILYPSNAEYGQGTLPEAQSLSKSTSTYQQIYGLSYTHAYSDKITLDETKQPSFVLKHGLATLMLKFKADPNGFLGTKQNYMSKITVRALNGTALSGNYTIDYETGTVTPGNEVNDYVTLNTNGASYSSTVAKTVTMTTLPTDKEITFEVKLETGSTVVPVLFKGQLKANQVNYFDLGLISTKTEYLNTKQDYYAKWLAGEDIVIDDESGHEYIINKTKFPTATVLRAKDISDVNKIQNKGLVFIDELKGDIKLQETPIADQYMGFATSNDAVIVGRWKDVGSQPVLWAKELRSSGPAVCMLNVGLKIMRKMGSTQGGGNVFGMNQGATANASVRMKDCRIDARGPQYVVDLQTISGTQYKCVEYAMFDNCIVSMPERLFDKEEGQNVKPLAMCFFIQKSTTEYSAARKFIVKNSILYTPDISYYYEPGDTPKGNRSERLVYISGQKMANTEFVFTNNTIVNISTQYGMCDFRSSTVGSFTFENNLGYLHDGTASAGGTNTYFSRNQSNTWTNTSHHIIGNKGCFNNWISSLVFKTFHISYKFPEVKGVCEDSDTYTVGSNLIRDPFTTKDYANGVFVIDETIQVLGTAGARTPKKYITATAQ